MPTLRRVTVAAGSLLLLAVMGRATISAEPGAMFPTDSRGWARAGEAKMIADLSKAQPASALTSGRREKGKWKTIPYATAGWEGQTLSVLYDTGAPMVSVPVEAAGWHAVYVGVCTVSAGLDKVDHNGVLAKLGGQTVYRRMSNGLPLIKPRRDAIQETFLDVADMTGRTVDLAPMPFKPATICYVKLVPLTPAEVEAWKQGAAPDRPTRTAITTFDGHSWIWPYRPRTADDLRGNFRGFERSDFRKWWFQVTGADLVCYPSKVGNIPGDGTRDFMRWEYAEYTEALEAMFAAGVDPLRVAREAAAEQGAEFHVMIRPAGWKGSMPWDEIFNSRFFEAHPEWRCVDRDGTPTLYMSFAVPEVRRHVLDVLRETLSLKPDGVGFLFMRGMPMILWEDAFSREFQAKYGEDPRTLGDEDPRVLELRAEVMTRMLREVRQMLDEVAAQQKLGRRYTISLATFSLEPDNRRFGLDVGRWAREGLVDDIAPAYFAHHTSFKQPDMKYYQRVTQGTKAKVYPFVIAWNSGKPQQLSQRVTQFYKDGAAGIAVWDTSTEALWRDGSPGNVWDIASVLGHRDLVARWAKDGPPVPLQFPLTRMGENHYSRWFPNTGF